MKKTALTILILFGWSIVSAQTNESIKILPGLGVDNIRLYKSKPSDLKTFRGEKLSKKTSTSGRCGNFGWKRIKYTTYYSKTKGIEFQFIQIELSRWLPLWNNKELISISINKPLDTSNGLKVGTSTKIEVLKQYGPMPEGWKHQAYIYFNHLGIAFDFNEQEIVTGIKIFKM